MDRIDKVHINKYLIGGRLVEWNSEKSEVYSVIKMKKFTNSTGSIPSLDENAAISAIKHADLAYNRGRGKWPTMKVQKRIECAEICK